MPSDGSGYPKHRTEKWVESNWNKKKNLLQCFFLHFSELLAIFDDFSKFCRILGKKSSKMAKNEETPCSKLHSIQELVGTSQNRIT